MISTAGTRPRPRAARTSRIEITALRIPASWRRTLFCWCDGKEETTRVMVSVASSVCRVERTRCPVSAEFNGVFDGDDVAAARGVDAVNHRRERCGFAGACRTRDQNQPALLVRDFVHDGRTSETACRARVIRDDAKDD